MRQPRSYCQILTLITVLFNESYSLSTSHFRISDLRISWREAKCCLDSSPTCDCPIELTFCAGVRFSANKNYKDCHYIHYRTPFVLSKDFPFDVDIPVSVRWPVSQWHLTVTGHNSQGGRVIDFSRTFQRVDAASGVTDVSFENENATLQFGFSIECELNYFGPGCAVYCNESLRDPSGGSFSCSPSGEKMCQRGWTGDLCNIPHCEQQCKYGKCTGPNLCSCDMGWGGPSCEKCLALTGCQHGYCQMAHQCICEKNWGGKLCDVDLDYCAHNPGLCKNGGSCTSDGRENYYYCNCTKEYEGRNCEIRKAEKCESVSCGIGECVEAPFTRCICPSGVVGDRCQYSIAERRWTAVDASLLSLLLLVVLLSLAFVCVAIKYYQEKVARIEKMSPLTAVYSPQWMTTDLPNRVVPLYEPRLHLSSPPPGYDSDNEIAMRSGERRSRRNSRIKSRVMGSKEKFEEEIEEEAV